MEAVYQLKPYELNDSFLKTIRELFGDKEVKITIETPQDETEYLLSDPLNRELLLAAVKADKEGRYAQVLTLEEAEALAQ